MNKIKVAVLMACYNGEDYIFDQVQSIIKQEEIDVNIYISIDKSDDNTHKICSDLSNNNSKIKIISKERIFGNAAKNFYNLIFNTEINNYDYISFSDQDDIWESKKLINGINILKNNKSYVAYSSNIKTFGKNNLIINKAQKQKKYDYLFEAGGPGCTYIFSKYNYNLVKKFLKHNFKTIYKIDRHDWLLYAVYRSKGFKWYIDTNSYIKYRIHQNNHVGINYGFYSKLKRFKFIFNGWYLDQIKKICILCESNSDNFFDNLLTRNRLRLFLFIISNIFNLRRKKIESIVLILLVFGKIY